MCMIFGLLCLIYTPFVCCLKKLDEPSSEDGGYLQHEMLTSSSINNGGRSSNRTFSSARTISSRSNINEHGFVARGGTGQLSIESLNSDDDAGGGTTVLMSSTSIMNIKRTPRRSGTSLPNAAFSYGEPTNNRQ
jgi:hypothetical protein